MSKFKVGDFVEVFNSELLGFFDSDGYQPGDKFIIQVISTSIYGSTYYSESSGCDAVREDCLRLVPPNEDPKHTPCEEDFNIWFKKIIKEPVT